MTYFYIKCLLMCLLLSGISTRQESSSSSTYKSFNQNCKQFKLNENDNVGAQSKQYAPGWNSYSRNGKLAQRQVYYSLLYHPSPQDLQPVSSSYNSPCRPYDVPTTTLNFGGLPQPIAYQVNSNPAPNQISSYPNNPSYSNSPNLLKTYKVPPVYSNVLYNDQKSMPTYNPTVYNKPASASAYKNLRNMPAYRITQSAVPYNAQHIRHIQSTAQTSTSYNVPQCPEANNAQQSSPTYSAQQTPAPYNAIRYPTQHNARQRPSTYSPIRTSVYNNAPSSLHSYNTARNPAINNNPQSSDNYDQPNRLACTNLATTPIYNPLLLKPNQAPRKLTTQYNGHGNKNPEYIQQTHAPPSYNPSVSGNTMPHEHHTSVFHDVPTSYAQSYNFIPIHRFNHFIKPAIGQYDIEFETGNGIRQQESGYLKSIPTRYSNGCQESYNKYQEPTVVNVKTGSVSWTSPEGIPFTLSYIADENGFRPMGSHLYTGTNDSPKYANNYGYNQNSGDTTNYENSAPSHYMPSIASSQNQYKN